MTQPTGDNRIDVCKTPTCDNSTVGHYRTCGPCRRWRTRLLVVEQYGGVCACCSEAELGFLTLDHIDGGGKAHREEVFASGRGDLWLWAWRNGCPDTLRLLCFNCNSGRARNGGVCPHERAYGPPGVIVGPKRIPAAARMAIVARYAAGERQIDLAAEFGISKQSVSNIVRRSA